MRHYDTYLTLKDNDMRLKYCSVCWDERRMLIQMTFQEFIEGYLDFIKYKCHVCKQSVSVHEKGI